jgi:hypothetical protein
LRAAAERALARDYPTAERAVRLAFQGPAPVPLRDLAALELAGVLGERFPERPIRLRRLIAAARRMGGAPYAVVGDSHSTHLVRHGRREGRWLLPLHRLCTGASARGLANPEASAQAGAKVRAFLGHLATAPMPTLFKFGQVDLEFVFTFKRLESSENAFDEAAFDAFADETVERYVAFLAEGVPAVLRPLARVAGVFPPALSDAAWRQGYVNAHIAALHGPADPAALDRLAGLEIPPLAVRTRLHARFNARLFEAAGAAGFSVLDGFEALLGPDGTLAPRFLGRARGANHHLGYAASRAPMAELAWDVAEAQSNR